MIKKTMIAIMNMIQVLANETIDTILMVRQQEANDAYIQGFRDAMEWDAQCEREMEEENRNK